MIESFIRRPAMTIVFIAVFMVLGIVSIKKMIIEATPKVEFPLVSITVVYGGASPDEIETQVLKKIEDAVSEVSEIKSMKADARENFGALLIEFNIEADVNVKSIEVKDKVEAILNDLPNDADRPVIAKFDPLLQPIAVLILDSESKFNLTELYEYGDKTLRSRLSAINGVASVDIVGGRERQINIWLDNNLLIQNYLSIENVVQALRVKNLNVPGGSIDRQDSKITVRFVGEFQSIREIEELQITSAEGRVYRLKDLARVEDGFKEIEKIGRFDGKEIVALQVKKLSDGDAVGIMDNLRKKIPELQKGLPEGMTLELGTNTTDIILSETNGTVKAIGLGIVLTIITILIFLGDIRGAVISAIVIPTSIISTFFTMQSSGFSINSMTLLAFGTCLGTLIANALIIIENVNNHLMMGKDNVRASVDGTKEVLIAVLAGSGTNIVVFTPLAMMGGIIGKFMIQFGLTVVFATLFSILASITLTPMLCAYLLKRPDTIKDNFLKRTSNFVNKIIHGFLDWFKPIYDFMMRRPLVFSIGVLIFFFSIQYPAKRIGSEFIPRSDRDEFSVELEMPDGTPVEKTTDVIIQVESELKKFPEVEHYFSDIGYDGENKARIKVQLHKLATRKKTFKDVIEELLPRIAVIPEAQFFLSGGNKSEDGLGDVTIDIAGSDINKMAEVADKFIEIMNDKDVFSAIKSSYTRPKMEVRFIPDQEKLILQRLNNAQMGSVIRALVNGNDDSVYKEGGEEYDINVSLDKGFKKTPEDFSQFLIMGKDGLIPIASLGEVKQVQAASPIKRRDRTKIIQLNGYLYKSTAGIVMKELGADFSKVDFPEGVSWRYTGKAENQAESAGEIGQAFLLAVILTYMLLVAILDSFVLPVSIASCIVTSFLGVFLLLFYLDGTINIGSMMAFVMVVGLAVNNSIMVIEYAHQLMAKGEGAVEAIWLAAKAKLLPILMTTIAIVTGTSPQLFDPDQLKSAMGIVVIGGMLASVIFTYVLTPPVHIMLLRFMNRFKKEKIKI